MKAKVIQKNVTTFIVQDQDGKNYQTNIWKKVKFSSEKIIVGDDVEVVQVNNDYVIEKIYPRKNKIIRPNVSNVDVLVLVCSSVEPDINVFQINKYLLFYEINHIFKIILYFSKMDLIDDVETKSKVEKIINAYKKDGYFCVCSHEHDCITILESYFDNKSVVCFAGESGSGKSTLINKIIPGANIVTNEISKSLNRGKHTTTTCSLINYKNYFLVDTPGFGTIDLDVDNKILAVGYFDFKNLSVNCKFSNCLHHMEKDCAVKQAVLEKKIWIERYNSYLKIIKNNKFKEKF